MDDGRVLVRQQTWRRAPRGNRRRQGRPRRRRANAGAHREGDGRMPRPSGTHELTARAARGLQRQGGRGGSRAHRGQRE